MLRQGWLEAQNRLALYRIGSIRSWRGLEQASLLGSWVRVYVFTAMGTSGAREPGGDLGDGVSMSWRLCCSWTRWIRASGIEKYCMGLFLIDRRHVPKTCIGQVLRGLLAPNDGCILSCL